jgi:Uma2 family endonuclease
MTMSVALTESDTIENLADLLRRLGGIPLSRIRFRPYPGAATEADVRKNKNCELIDGVLVEVAMGYRESPLGVWISALLNAFVIPRNLGLVSGADGTVRLFPGLVRIPDIAFASWDRFPGRRPPRRPIPHLAPDLAIEVLSRGNTPREMTRKRREYFAAGVRLVWEIDPRVRGATVYTAPDQSTVLTQGGKLDGGDVLPGFTLSLADVFAEWDRHG